MKNKIIPKALLAIIIFLCGLLSLGGCVTSQNQQEQTGSTVNESQNIEQPAAEEIIIVTGEYAPYTSQHAAGYGAFTQIVSAALNESGLKYKIEFYPWARASEMVENGEAWASFPYGFTAELAHVHNYSDPIIQSPHRFYYLKSNEKLAQEGIDFSKISDFSSYTFGGANDYWYGDKAAIENSGVKAEWASDTDALLKMLHAGRIDFMIEDQWVADEAIARLFPDAISDFMTLPNPAAQQDYYLIIAKEYPNTQLYREKFNAALQVLKNNGTIDRILTEYGLASNRQEVF